MPFKKPRNAPNLGSKGKGVTATSSSSGETGSGANVYQPLAPRRIRLLKLLPGSDSDKIKIQLQSASLDDPGPYKALSYVWGNATTENPIYLDDTAKSVAKSVTANLFNALSRFRDVSESRIWWIDALCIDQSSITERNQQVKMMMEIYAKAEETIMWLGEDNNPNLEMMFKVAKARYEYARHKHVIQQPQGEIPVFLCSGDLESMKIVAKVRDRLISQGRCQPVDVLKHLESLDTDPAVVAIGFRDVKIMEAHNGPKCARLFPDLDKIRVQKAENEDFSNFITFLIEAIRPVEIDLTDAQCNSILSGLSYIGSRPYWRRAWIVQEAIVSKKATLVCGNHEIDFDTFCMVYGSEPTISLDVNNVILEDIPLFNARASWKRVIRAIIASPDQNIDISFFYVLDKITQIGCRRSRGQFKRIDGLTLGHLLNVFGRQDASDPRDLIFSLAGLLRHFSDLPLQHQWAETCTDYSLDVQTVFKTAAKHIVESYPQHRADKEPRKNYILSFFEFDPSRDSTSLPSWVPNWASNRDTPHILFAEDNPEIDTLIEYDAKVEGDFLVLSGHIVDTVAVPSDIGDDDYFYAEVDAYNMAMEKDLGAMYGSHEARFEAFWRTIVADNPISTRPMDSYCYVSLDLDAIHSWVTRCSENYRKIQQIWSHRLKHRSILGPLLSYMKEKHQQDEKNSPLDPRILKHTPREVIKYIPLEIIKETFAQQHDSVWSCIEAGITRQFIITRHGFFGIGPPGVKAGDVVAILAGSGNPWYLRKQGGHYIVIGKSWIHGLMYRDDDYHKQGWSDKIETIRLR